MLGVHKADGSTSSHPSESEADSAAGHEGGPDDEDAGGHARVPDDRYIPMLDELAGSFEEHGDDIDRDDRFFVIAVLTGRWTLEHTGDWWDRLECTPRAGLPSTWCNRYFSQTVRVGQSVRTQRREQC